MDHRKDYVAPAIAVEDVLEQTSLACMVSEPYPGKSNGETPAIFATGLPCSTLVNKGGVFIGDAAAAECTIQAPKPSQLVVLS